MAQANVKSSFRKRSFIEVFCSKCGTRFNDNAEFNKVFENKSEAVETITEENWTVKGKAALCEKCSN